MHWDRFQEQLASLLAEDAADASAQRHAQRRDSDIAQQAKNWNFVLGGPARGASVEALQAELEEFVAASSQIEQDVMEMEATATDRRTLVEVTVNASGIVQRTTVLAAGQNSSAADLATAFTAAAQEAAALVHTKVTAAWAPLHRTMAELDSTLPIDEVSGETADFLSAAQARSDALFPRLRDQHADKE